MIPLFEQDGFIITFEALPEEVEMRHHFIQECGWSAAEFRPIRHFEWFCAKVSAWQDGVEMGVEYLGCCCYRTVEEFYTTYKDCYFADMVNSALQDSKRLACKLA